MSHSSHQLPSAKEDHPHVRRVDWRASTLSQKSQGASCVRAANNALSNVSDARAGIAVMVVHACKTRSLAGVREADHVGLGNPRCEKCSLGVPA